MGSNLKITMLCPGPTFTNFLNESFTGVPGEVAGVTLRSFNYLNIFKKLNQAVKETDRRMSADRCGQLCAIAIANELYEGWMALFPILPIVYIALYFPNLTRL